MTYEDLLAENLRLRARVQELEQENARYVYGLSATPTRQDGMTPIVFMQCGPIRYKSDAKAQVSRQSFSRVLIPRFTPFRAIEEKGNALQYLGDLANDRARNELIVQDVVSELNEGRTPIILTKRKDHISILADMLAPYCRNVVQLIGTASTREKRLAMDQLKSIPETEPLIIIATGKYVGEGFNYPRLDTLFIALPVAYPNIVQQYTGRLHRDYEGKTEVRVYDYIDIHVPVIDRSLLWFGSIDLAGSHHREEDNVMRVPGSPRCDMMTGALASPLETPSIVQRRI